ncbi:MAG: hypothetical protein KJZ80_05960 [Hyphomicrobiaceae bacterium]|nr:hypothetical protein [Hyphomicrobiaceae bacterium]
MAPPPRWLAVLVMLAFVATGTLHFAETSHASTAAHHAESTTGNGGEEPSGSEPDGQVHAGTCAGFGGCPLCGPVIEPLANALAHVEAAACDRSIAVHTGVVFALFRPPKPVPA